MLVNMFSLGISESLLGSRRREPWTYGAVAYRAFECASLHYTYFVDRREARVLS